MRLPNFALPVGGLTASNFGHRSILRYSKFGSLVNLKDFSNSVFSMEVYDWIPALEMPAS